ncbi:MAG: hypothetical protein ACE5FL_09660, partial [Myxococcota bacterium]
MSTGGTPVPHEGTPVPHEVLARTGRLDLGPFACQASTDHLESLRLGLLFATEPMDGDAMTSTTGPSAIGPRPAVGRKGRKAAPRGTKPARGASRTPAMQQYLEQKAQVGEAVLLFRMGDFYETFYEDAKTIARVLGLTLTARNKSSREPIPLAGVPYHAVDGYVAKLVRAGYKVAISEQIEDPKKAKGVVKRAIQRIITPGTLTDEALLEERRPNHLAALCPERGDRSRERVGLACVELASGRFFAEMIARDAVADELARLGAAELLVPEADIDTEAPFADRFGEATGAAVSRRPPHVFDRHTAEQVLCGHFGVKSLEGFGFDRFDASLCAAGALLDYLRETQKSALSHVLKIVPRHSDHIVMIDETTLRSLEVERTMRDGAREGSLLDAIDTTVNPMGARRLREWVCFPLREPAQILDRQIAVADLRTHPDRLRQVRDGLGDMGDVERIVARLGVGRASPRDMVGLGRALLRCGELAEVIGPGLGDGKRDLLTTIREALSGLHPLGTFLTTALRPDAPPIVRDGGFIADGYNAELDRLRHVGVDGRQWLA